MTGSGTNIAGRRKDNTEKTGRNCKICDFLVAMATVQTQDYITLFN